MKIAHITPVMNTVPPEKYGGIEQDIVQLAKGQASAGHGITIFAARGSKAPASGVQIFEAAPYPTRERTSENRSWEIKEFLQVISMQDNFDLLHFHYEPIIARVNIDGVEQNLLNFIRVPSVITFHNTTHIDANINYYKENKDLWKFNYVFLSKNHQAPLSFFPNSGVIYNGIPVADFKFNNKPDEYLLFLGRITKAKGIIEAIQCAKEIGKKLVIAAKIDPVDRDFYEGEVKHLIDGKQIIYVGEVDFNQKVELYKNALCTLFPILWEEPFGLVMIESMACGTPVVAFRRGSVPEIIQDGRTGFIVDNVFEMAKAVGDIGKINRGNCRKHVEQNFSSEKMVVDYLRLYTEILNKNFTCSQSY